MNETNQTVKCSVSGYLVDWIYLLWLLRVCKLIPKSVSVVKYAQPFVIKRNVPHGDILRHCACRCFRLLIWPWDHLKLAWRPFRSTLHGHSACSCIVISMGGSAFVRVSWHKTFCYVLFCPLVSCLYLFLSNKHFEGQLKVQVQNLAT